MDSSVYIAGMGTISAAGMNCESGFASVVRGDDNVKPLTRFESGLNIRPLCAVVNDDVDSRFTNSFRSLSLARIAASEAMGGLTDRSGLKIGIVAATTVGGISVTERIYEQLKKDPSLKINSRDLAVHEPCVISAELCRDFNACGFHTVSTACSTGLHAIGMAKRFIEKGIYDAVLAVGTDALSLLTVRGFGSLTLLDQNGCRPFDKRRAGISLGEGAGAMLLVGSAHKGRCKKAHAVISGWGASADAFHMTAPHPEGDGAIRSMQSALNESGLDISVIDCVVTHGTATPDNDKSEIRAIRSVLGTVPPFCSMKRTLGHTLAASGIIEAVFGVMSLNNNVIPPTAGFEEPDDEIGISPGSVAIYKPVTHVLKNSFGFGGNNASVIFSKADV
jgi:3-oxoacyl-[acyl-carrier-protein] synthase-1